MKLNENTIKPQKSQYVQTIVGEGFKKCTVCNLEKTFNNYNKQKNGKFGLLSRCNSCLKKYRQEYMKRPEAKESHRIRSQKWRDENPEEKLKRSREQYKKFGHIYNSKSKEKYNTDLEYRLKKLEADKKYSDTGKRRELYRLPKNLEYNLKRCKVYKSNNVESVKKQKKEYTENLPDTLIKIRLGFKKKDEIPNEIIETKRLTILLKRTLKNN